MTLNDDAIVNVEIRACRARNIDLQTNSVEEVKLPIESLISDVISLDEINLGMEKLASGDALRQVISL